MRTVVALLFSMSLAAALMWWFMGAVRRWATRPPVQLRDDATDLEIALHELRSAVVVEFLKLGTRALKLATRFVSMFTRPHVLVVVLAASLSLLPVPSGHPDGELVRLHIVAIGGDRL